MIIYHYFVNVCKKNILLIAAIGLLGTVSTLNLKNSIPTTFAQSMTTAANNTQGMLFKFPFKPGIFVIPLSCTTPNDALLSCHLAGNTSAAAQMIKNQMMMAGGPDKNMITNQLKQALNMFSFNVSPTKTVFRWKDAYTLKPIIGLR